MYRCLSPGAIGVRASLEEGIELAKSAGFQGLEVSIGDIADRIEKGGVDPVRRLFAEAGIKPGAWGLPVNWQAEDDAFAKDLERLPRFARAGQALECTRTATWVLSFSDSRPFGENWAYHKDRLGRVASVLKEYGCTFGLEFLGPQTIWKGHKHEFIHTMEQMLELAAACGSNVGLLLDCWHWHTSGGTADDLRALRPEQVVYVHVNDAPTGLSMEQYVDNNRALPGETGVIDIRSFLQVLNQIGYEGPVTPEPFSSRLKEMAPEEATRVVGESMQKIWSEAGL